MDKDEIASFQRFRRLDRHNLRHRLPPFGDDDLPSGLRHFVVRRQSHLCPWSRDYSHFRSTNSKRSTSRARNSLAIRRKRSSASVTRKVYSGVPFPPGGAAAATHFAVVSALSTI